MRKQLFTILTLLFLFSACSKENNIATLKIINQTECVQNIFKGLDENSEFLGTVLENETKELMFESENVNRQFFYSDPHQSCSGLFGQQYRVDVNGGESTTIIIQ